MFSQKLVNVCFGQSTLLAFDCFDQAIIDFDLDAGMFTFVDRVALGIPQSQVNDLIIDDGLVF